VNFSQIFARGSAQFHVPLELSDKYFSDFSSKEDLYSILEMCRLQTTTYTHLKNIIEEDIMIPH
jgi:hypothetical protein